MSEVFVTSHIQIETCSSDWAASSCNTRPKTARQQSIKWKGFSLYLILPKGIPTLIFPTLLIKLLRGSKIYSPLLPEYLGLLNQLWISWSLPRSCLHDDLNVVFRNVFIITGTGQIFLMCCAARRRGSLAVDFGCKTLVLRYWKPEKLASARIISREAGLEHLRTKAMKNILGFYSGRYFGNVNNNSFIKYVWEENGATSICYIATVLHALKQ